MESKLELVPEGNDYYFEKEWESFEDKDLMDRDDFERRMGIIYDIEDVEEIEKESIKDGKYMFLLGADIRRFISPEAVVDKIKRKAIVWREWDNVAQYIVMTLPEDRKLVVSKAQTFLTNKTEEGELTY